MEIFSNLNVRDAVGATYSASSTVYDSKGAPHTVTVTFAHTGLVAGVDTWTYSAAVPDADTNLGTVGSGTMGTGTLQFNASGTLISPVGNVNLSFTNAGVTSFRNGANAFTAANPLSWRLYQTSGAVLGAPIVTGYPIPSSTSATNTDGYPPGNLTSVIINKDGVLQGVFSNGQVEELAQLGIAQFNNPKGLIRLGRNLFAETNASGTASIGAADTGGRGTIVGSSLEASNVDMASEFTKMLIFERGYQANSKIITTSDTIIQTAISLVR
jgi:flagellar hook protein FlgE